MDNPLKHYIKLFPLKKYLLFLLIFFFSKNINAQQKNIQLAKQYYQQGNLEKALDSFNKLAKKPNNLQFIHQDYFGLLIKLNKFIKAEKHIKKIIKLYPRNPNYKIDKGNLIQVSKGELQANQYYLILRNNFSKDIYIAQQASQYYSQKGKIDEAIKLLLLTKAKKKDKTLFALELANMYRYINKKEEMIEQYIIFAKLNDGNINYVKNALQAILNKPEDIKKLETFLFQKIQKEPENKAYTQLLIWANIQTKNFSSAFIQARALDKRLAQGGKPLLKIAEMAISNKYYVIANKILKYLMYTYTGSKLSIKAYFLQLTTKEKQIKSIYPVSKESLLQLIERYKMFIKQNPAHFLAYKANLQMVQIQAYYLNKKNKAIESLKKLIKKKNGNLQIQSEAKLILGDIYLLNEEPWESTLMYAQVDKKMKETPIGYTAKIKRAKLAYYQGEFELAQTILDILKLATSRKIANDALDLSLFIKENMLFDSTYLALKTYASLELLLYQHKNKKVLASIDTIITHFKGQSLEDDFLFLKATELKKEANFQQAAKTYAQIVQNFGKEILADKSLFLQADIYQNHLNHSKKAQELYLKLLKKYPGSIYVAESRKRYRIIRGDFIQNN